MMALDMPMETKGIKRLAHWLKSFEMPIFSTSRMA